MQIFINCSFCNYICCKFFLKGSLTISYTDSDDDEVAKIFGKNNQFAIIYDSQEEEKSWQTFGKT